MVMLDVGPEPGSLPGRMRSGAFHGIDLEKRTPAAAAAWRNQAERVRRSCASRPPRATRSLLERRWAQTPLTPPNRDFKWPDDVLALIWAHARRGLHAALKARLFREVHEEIRARGDFRMVPVYNYEEGDTGFGELGVDLYCRICGSRRLVTSAFREFHSYIPGTGGDEATEFVWHVKCESCGDTAEFRDMEL